jgi:hypothetical protein
MGIPRAIETPNVSATMHYLLQGYRYAQAVRLAHWERKSIRRGRTHSLKHSERQTRSDEPAVGSTG